MSYPADLLAQARDQALENIKNTEREYLEIVIELARNADVREIEIAI